MSKSYGLIGCPLGHSFSPQIHGYLGDYDYNLNEIQKDELSDFAAKRPLDGFNVTIPYKVDIMQYLDEISDIAKRIGAVNTVAKRADGTLFGDNTDYYGLKELIEYNKIEISGENVLILGTGGAAQMAVTLMEDMGAKEILIASRTPKEGARNIGYSDIKSHPEINVVINATPVGMYPNVDNSPISLEDVPNCRGIIDIVANPVRSKLVLEALDKGIKAAGGLRMLVAQAIKAYEIFKENSSDEEMKNVEPKIKGTLTEVTDEIMKHLKKDVMNIVFVGMPGSGKTTSAKRLSKMTGMPMLDTDDMLVEKTGRKIPEIFATDGEEVFRAIEREVVKEASLKKGHIIATGGGAVLSKENRDHLKHNGFVVYLDAPIDILATEGRPLSKDRETLEKMKNFRDSLYKDCADEQVVICKDYKKSFNNLKDILADFLN